MTKSWSASLEHGEYETDRVLVINHGIEAVEETATGVYVNIVTPHSFGNPDKYLTPVLKQKFGEEITIKYIDQCGCGGHVLRIYK